MKKIFLSPFFILFSFLVLWGVFAGLVYMQYQNDIVAITEEGGLVEGICHFGYVLLIAVLLLLCHDFHDKIRTWGVLLFLGLCAFLREAGIHHHLSSTDTTPFKSRFFLNPNNYLHEKIIFGFLLLVVLSAVIYLICKYSKHLVVSFLKFDTISWSIAVLCFIGVASKIIDRFPANWRKSHGGVYLDENITNILLLIEESSEMFLPYIACGILLQHHFLDKSK